MSTIPKHSLRGLRTFCVAARHESFRLAAEDLFVTASAVSHQIKTLEEELGEQLFDRNARRLRLTPFGRALYEDVYPLIEQLESVVAKHRASPANRTIRISVQPFFASELFAPRLPEFTTANPHIDIEVGTSDESSEKHPSDADLSIRLFRSPPANLPSNLLLPLRVAVAGSPDFAKRLRVKGKKVVSDFPMIVHKTNADGWELWSKASGIGLPKVSTTTRFDSMIAVVRAAEQGVGAALVPVPLADLWFQHGSIVRLFDQELVTDASYYLVCREDRLEDDDVQRLREWILATFRPDS
ncbi:MAG: LysR substrate-binding domain-containing protein [Pseudomonadota bacterium]